MKEAISSQQLYAVLVVFLIGNTILFSLGEEAKQDAWLAVLLASIGGVILAIAYVAIHSQWQGRDFFEQLFFSFPKPVAILITVAFIGYALYYAAFILRDVCEMLVSVLLMKTPLEVLLVSFATVLAFGLLCGIEPIVRTAQLLLPFVVLVIVFASIGVMLTGEFHLHQLQPSLVEGGKPIVAAMFPRVFVTPYGGVMILLVLVAKLGKGERRYAPIFLAIMTAMVLLVLVAAVEIGTLGEMTRERTNFAFLSATREVSLLNFIERVDSLVIIVIMMTSFIKIVMYLYVVLCAVTAWTKRSGRDYIAPAIATTTALALCAIQTSSTQQLYRIEVLPFVHLAFQLSPLLLSLMMRRMI